MDELTVERFGPGVPSAEARRRPRPLKPRVVETPAEVIERRRAILNGDDEDEMALRTVVLAKDRKLAEVIRRWVA